MIFSPSFFSVSFVTCLILVIKVSGAGHDDILPLLPPNRNSSSNTERIFSQIVNNNNNSTTISNCTNDYVSPFHLELKTDNEPEATSWELIDVYTNEVIHSVKTNSYSRNWTIYNEHLCIPSESCYQFTIHNMWGTGLCDEAPCTTWYDGYYTILYGGNAIITHGGGFNYRESSDLFGDGCETQSPSSAPSMQPSRSLPPPSNVSDMFIIILVIVLIALPVAVLIAVHVYFVTSAFCCRERIPDEITNNDHNNQQTNGASTLEERRQHRREKVLANIIHKVSKNLLVGLFH